MSGQKVKGESHIPHQGLLQPRDNLIGLRGIRLSDLAMPRHQGACCKRGHIPFLPGSFSTLCWLSYACIASMVQLNYMKFFCSIYFWLFTLSLSNTSQAICDKLLNLLQNLPSKPPLQSDLY